MIKNRNILSVILCLHLCFTSAMPLLAQDPAKEVSISPEEQQILWQQEDFVRAYLVVAEHGGALYSIFGHACLHLVCPAYQLDYYFTYESENAAQKILTFFAGKLNMGMMALEPEQYLEGYRVDGREVKEYEFNLPIDVKRNLWRVLDEHVNMGICLPYNFEKRGCAFACYTLLNEALGNTQINYAPWPDKYSQTRRELAYNFAREQYPWNLFFIMTIVGTEIDKAYPAQQKLIIPTDLLEVWQMAEVNGKPLLAKEPTIVLASNSKHKAPWFSPTWAAILLLFGVLLGWMCKFPYADWLTLAIISCIGGIITYLVCFSSLPCTGWNWLIVPFNLLPLIFWHWRRYWALPFAILVLLWLVIMLFWPHRIVDNAHYILALTWNVVLIKQTNIINIKI